MQTTLACQLSSTLMQLLFSFDWDTRVEKTLMQTLACQLSCNSCSRLTGTRELRKLSCKLSLVNSHQLSWKLSLVNSHQLSWKLSLVNSHQLSWKLSLVNSHQLSWKLSLVNSHQLSCNSCSRLTGTRELRKLSCKLSLVNSHATLVPVLVVDTRTEKTLVQTHACQLSCNSCSRLTEA